MLNGLSNTNCGSPKVISEAALAVLLVFRAASPCFGAESERGTFESALGVPDRIAAVENHLCLPVLLDGEQREYYSLPERMRLYRVPGVSIAVINNGEIEWSKGYGRRDAVATTPVDDRTLFQAGSISKPVSALGALHLVQEGLLDLDTDINTYLTSWKIPKNGFTAHKPVTLRYLLCHGAGMNGHMLGAFSPSEPIPNFLQMLNGLAPATNEPVEVVLEPQTEWRYSGGGYLIVLQAMLDVTGESFERIMDESVFAPLKMRRSGYYPPETLDSIGNIAVGHDETGAPYDDRWTFMPNLAEGGLWSTPSELCRLALEVQEAPRGISNIIGGKIAREMLTRQTGSYGLGFSLRGGGDRLVFEHGGDSRGYHNVLFVYAERGQGVVIMTNAQGGAYLYQEILRSVATVYDWPDLKPSVLTPVELPAGSLDRYAGRYVFNEIIPVTITVEHDHLRMEGDDGRVFECCPVAEDRFVDVKSGWRLDFIPDEDGSVSKALLSAEGAELIGERTAE